jgi:hypothetical protein
MTTAIVAPASGDVNVNATQVADCIKSSNQLLHTVYYNICNGTVQSVPVGGLDLLSYAGMFLLLAPLVILLCAMVYKLLTDF